MSYQDLTDEYIDKLLRTPIPGGSEASAWFLPHETDKGLANIREVVRLMVIRDRMMYSTHHVDYLNKQQAIIKECEDIFIAMKKYGINKRSEDDVYYLDQKRVNHVEGTMNYVGDYMCYLSYQAQLTGALQYPNCREEVSIVTNNPRMI